MALEGFAERSRYRAERWRWADTGKVQDPPYQDGVLDLAHVKLTDARIARLQAVCPSLYHLSLSGQSLDEAEDLLSQCPKLTGLNAETLNSDDRLLDILARAKNLQSLSIGQGTATPDALRRLVKATSLQVLTVFNAALTPNDAELIQSAREDGESMEEAMEEFLEFNVYRGADDKSDRIW